MSTLPRVYLDNAATSWPKPEAVYAAVDHDLRQLGAAASRGSYAEAVEVNRRVERSRADCASLLGVANPEHVIFCANGTDALNLAIHGLLRAGDHVVTTDIEHNSVLRPLAALERRHMIDVTRVECNADGFIDPQDVRKAILPNTRLIVLAHASNVTGAIQPAKEVISLAHASGARVLIDAAQTAGHIPIDVAELEIDLLATSGHKGLLGPLGTGLLYIRPGIELELVPVRQGGTGTSSDEDWQPDALPGKYESGNLNVPGILGLGAGVGFLLAEGITEAARREAQLTARLLGGLADIPAVTLYGPRSGLARVGLVSLTIEGYDPQEAAAALDASFRIQVRSGLHCAPRMHRSLKTLSHGGTIRLSIGHFTTAAEIDAALAAIRSLASG